MKTVLITGASGYIASRLIPRLLARGHRVRCLVRDPLRLARRDWYPQVEVAAGDVTRSGTLAGALQEIGTAYYLVHNMAAGEGYEQLELQAARNFARAARAAGVEHIIYLGGLAQVDERGEIAAHLK